MTEYRQATPHRLHKVYKTWLEQKWWEPTLDQRYMQRIAMETFLCMQSKEARDEIEKLGGLDCFILRPKDEGEPVSEQDAKELADQASASWVGFAGLDPTKLNEVQGNLKMIELAKRPTPGRSQLDSIPQENTAGGAVQSVAARKRVKRADNHRT